MATRINKKIEKELIEIAKRNSYLIEERDDLEKRHSDSQDFLDISVWSLKKMLEEAYELGRQSKK